MIKSLIFYLENWGVVNIINRAEGPNMTIPNVGEMIIFYYNQVPRHFIVKERILDYAANAAHLKVELATPNIDIDDLRY